VPNLVQQRRPPSQSVIVRARAEREMSQRALGRAVERVERARTAHARAAAAAHTVFFCPGCGLWFQQRRSADPLAGPPLRCLCCAFLLTIADTRAREAVRRVLARAELQRRFGGRDAPPPVARGVLRLLP
jgi:hypothetical protein